MTVEGRTLSSQQMSRQQRRWLGPDLLLIVLILWTIIAIILVGLPELPPWATAPLTPPLATINGEVISLDALRNRVNLYRVQQFMSGQAPQPLDPAMVLQRMILERLIIQAAHEAGVQVSEGELEDQINVILAQSNLSRQDMQGLLERNRLEWADFETSVHDYLLMLTFVENNILVDVPPEEQAAAFSTWVTDRVSNSEIQLNLEVLSPGP